MKQEANMEHSAEWLRGAYRIASRYAPMDVVMQINVQLAAAEAREAGEREAARVGDLFNDIAYREGGGYDQGDVSEAIYKAYELGANSIAVQLTKAREAQPSAAEGGA